MKQESSSLSLAIRRGLAGVNNAIRAKLAHYLAAAPSRTRPQATRINSNPNATMSQYERVQMMWDGEAIVKSSDFGTNYVKKRRMYCTNGMNYSPDTGDVVLNEEISDYLKERFKTMGVNCSMQTAFSRTADIELPMRGDSALVWKRDLNGMRLMEVQADRIGEIYQYYCNPEVIDGLNYYAGIYTFPNNADQFAGTYAFFKIYERIDQWYGNPATYPASDVMFFKDDLMAGFRGVSLFAQALPIVQNRDMILNATMQTMLQQSKVAAIASNNAGEPDEKTYDQQTLSNGTVEYIERNGDGPITKWQFNGDSYQVLRGEHPTDSFQLAMDRLDEKGSLACGFPYEFLFSPRDTGGAPSRFSFEVAGKEIERLRENVYTPQLDKISYVTIMDAVERKVFPPLPMITKGIWNFNTLPSADAFRDDKSDVMAVRAGTKTRDDVTRANSGRPYSVVLRAQAQEAVAQANAVVEANKDLLPGATPITKNDIAQISDNPQAEPGAPDPVLDREKKLVDYKSQSKSQSKEPPAKASLSDGQWITVHGRHILIKDGESVDEALHRDTHAYNHDNIDISDDTKSFPEGWQLKQDGGLFVIRNKDNKIISASASRDGAIQQAKNHPSHPDYVAPVKSPKKQPRKTAHDKAIDDLQSSVNKAKMSAYMGDVTVGDLPDDTRAAIAGIMGTNGHTDKLRAVKYGMVASELERMADPHNLEAAQHHIRNTPNYAAEQEVHDDDEKHILVMNGRVVDGHHFLAKALKGKVTKSLPVIDLTPARFQVASMQGDGE